MNKLKYRELRAKCKKHGLTMGGTKIDMAKRIRGKQKSTLSEGDDEEEGGDTSEEEMRETGNNTRKRDHFAEIPQLPTPEKDTSIDFSEKKEEET